MKESATQKVIRDYLSAQGFYIERRTVALASSPDGKRRFRVGAIPGASDLTGYQKGSGRHLEVETKATGRNTTSRQRKILQDAWLQRKREDGCIAFRASSVEDCQKELMVEIIGGGML